MEKRCRAAAVELRGEGDKRRIVGTSAVFYRADDPGTEYEIWPGVYERVMPGAFDSVLAGKPDVRALFNHDPSQILGRTKANTLGVSTDRRGLQYEVAPSESEAYRSVAEAIARGDVDGSSFQFRVKSETWRKEQRDGKDIEIREINEIAQLLDVGPVTFPAYEGTAAGVRDSQGLVEARSSYELWRNSLTAERQNRERDLRKHELTLTDVGS